MALKLHETDVNLQGSVGQQTDEVGLGGYLQRHEVENDNTQRTDVLGMGPGIVHHEDVLAFEKVYGR
jgi:hypothetical protein